MARHGEGQGSSSCIRQISAQASPTASPSPGCELSEGHRIPPIMSLPFPHPQANLWSLGSIIPRAPISMGLGGPHAPHVSMGLSLAQPRCQAALFIPCQRRHGNQGAAREPALPPPHAIHTPVTEQRVLHREIGRGREEGAAAGKCAHSSLHKAQVCDCVFVPMCTRAYVCVCVSSLHQDTKTCAGLTVSLHRGVRMCVRACVRACISPCLCV